MGRLVDADRLKEVFSRNIVGGNAYFDLIDSAPTVEAIPIPKNATNGDIIKALFPDKQFVSICSDRIYDYTTDNMIDCNLDWWNAPYKENTDGNK